MNSGNINRNALILVCMIAFGIPLVVRSATYLHILVLLYF
jgi:branched-chain amino acid transport system permease protein